jgi:DNA-binding NarL/FixJ family response regulator
MGGLLALMEPGGYSKRRTIPSGAASLQATTRRSQVRLILVEPRDLVRDCVANCLRVADPGFAVTEYSSVDDVESAQGAGASVVVLSFPSTKEEMPDVAAEVGRAQGQLPEVPVVVVADGDNLSFVRELIGSGVRGYIPTSFDFATFKEAIQFVAAGGTFVPASVLLDREQVSEGHGTDGSARQATQEITHESWHDREEYMAAASFTPRELAVLSHLKDGKPNKLIARELAICEGTVKIHIRRIMKKLRVENRTQAALVAMNLQLAGVRNLTVPISRKNDKPRTVPSGG